MTDNIVVDACIIIAVTVLLSVLCVVSLGALDAIMTHYQCNERAMLDPDHTYIWTLWNGCMIKLPSGYLVDYKDYPVPTEREGR